MTKQKHATAALLGLAFAGGTILTAGTATASVPAGQRTVIASSAAHAASQAPANRPRCRWVRGHWRWDYRRGHRAWVPGHRMCW
ncbi:MAG: hypothetical protein ACRDP6_36930 [Actinoallomurus sp.]